MVLALLLPFKVCVLLILLKSSFSLTLERHQSVRHRSNGTFDEHVPITRIVLDWKEEITSSVVNKLAKSGKTEVAVSNRLPGSKARGSNLLAKDFTQREDWASKGLIHVFMRHNSMDRF